MKVRIGYFDERSAFEVVKALKSVGIGAEIRKSITLSFVPAYFVEGRFSDLRNKYEETELVEDIKEWKRRLEMAAELGSLKEVGDRFDPETFEILRDMLETNGMLEGERIKDPPKDPFISFPVEADDDTAKKLDLKRKLVAFSNVEFEVFAELGHAIFNDRLGEICEEKGEFVGLLLMAGMAERLLEELSGGGKSVESLRRIRRFTFGDVVELRVTGDVVEGVLEALERMGLVRIKKGRVQLR